MNSRSKKLHISVFALTSSNYYYNKKMEFTGGSERQMRNIVDCLSLIGGKVNVFISGSNLSIQKRKDINIIPLLNSKDSRLVKIIKVFYGLKKNESDIIYLRGISSQNLVVLLISALLNKKIILSIASDLQVMRSNSNYNNLIKKMSFYLAKKIVVQTKQQQILLYNNFNKNGQIFNNIINKKYFIDNQNKINNYHDRTIDRIWIGTIEKRKGVDHFISLANNFPQKIFVLIGGSNKNDDEYAKSKIKSIKNIQNINYLGFKQPNQIARYLNDAKVLISTSQLLNNNYTKEGFPNIFLEAWLFGTPVISMHCDPDNLISNNGLGCLAPNIDSINKTFISLLNDKNKWEKISENTVTFSLSRDINNIKVQRELQSLFVD